MILLRYPGILVLCILFSRAAIVAQPFPEGYHMPVHTDAWVLTADTATIETVLRDHPKLFASTDLLGTASPHQTYWFRLDFHDQEDKINESDTLFLVTGLLTKMELYVSDSSTIRSIRVDYTSRRNYRGKISALTVPVARRTLIGGRYVFVRIPFVRGYPNFRGLQFRYNTEAGDLVEQNFISVTRVASQVPVFILLGIASLLFIFNILLYYSGRERQYLFYGAFLLFQVTYYTRGSPVLSDFIFGDNYRLWYLSTELSQVAANLGYLLFVKYFLETRNTLPTLDRVIRGVAAALMAFIVIDLVLLLADPFFRYQSYLMFGQRYFMAGFALWGVIYLLLKGRGYLPFFIVAGTIAYVGGALATMFSQELNYMVTGSSLETIIFALGLSYKIRQMNREKLRLEQEANQVRLSALRAQMNPHFIFNSLNSIQHLITRNDKINALRYLTRFSTLLRQVLESSISVNIPVIREIELLKIYLELEAFRFDQSFKYSIEVDDGLDVHNVEVPILLLQPYVENAITHGLLPRQEGEKELFILFEERDDYILCTIRDTGIGRAAAMERKRNINGNRPSRGIELSRQRLELVSRKSGIENLITYIDSGQGTTVEIRIPKS